MSLTRSREASLRHPRRRGFKPDQRRMQLAVRLGVGEGVTSVVIDGRDGHVDLHRQHASGIDAVPRNGGHHHLADRHDAQQATCDRLGMQIQTH